MSNIEKVINVKLITQFLKTNEISVDEFCLHSGVKYNTFKKILAYSTDVFFNDIVKIAFFMNLEMRELSY